MKNDCGCLMGMINPTNGPHIIKFGKTVIPQDILFTKTDDDSYGYETEPHITVKYGYLPDLTNKQLASILGNIKPFNVILHTLSQFNNPEFDVIKFDVESEILKELRKRADIYPNKDKYIEYHPHLTLAYTKPKTFSAIKNGLNLKVNVNRFKYSRSDGSSIYINL